MKEKITNIGNTRHTDGARNKALEKAKGGIKESERTEKYRIVRKPGKQSGSRVLGYTNDPKAKHGTFHQENYKG